MDEDASRLVTLVSKAPCESEPPWRGKELSPHLKHPSLRNLYGKLARRVYDFACKHTPVPDVLDLGAGDGTFTLEFLELGARVTAVDMSESQLAALKVRCSPYAAKLEVRRQDAFDAIRSMQAEHREYHIVVANSFLHHIPDYPRLIREAAALLAPHGQFFSFQDPLRYDSLGRLTRIFSAFAYLTWRIFRGDIVGGIKRRIRRIRGTYLECSKEDNAEYHVVRRGVDQDAIHELFRRLGFECELLPYFSTQSPFGQVIGDLLRLQNAFAALSRKQGDGAD